MHAAPALYIPSVPHAACPVNQSSSPNKTLLQVRQAFTARGWTVLPHECHIERATACPAGACGVVGAAGAAAADFAKGTRRGNRRSRGGSRSHGLHVGRPSGVEHQSTSEPKEPSGGVAGRNAMFFKGLGCAAALAGIAAVGAGIFLRRPGTRAHAFAR